MTIDEMCQDKFFQKVLELNSLYKKSSDGWTDSFKLIDIIPTNQFGAIKGYQVHYNPHDVLNTIEMKVEYVHGLYLYFTGNYNDIADCISGITHYQLIRFVESKNGKFYQHNKELKPGDIIETSPIFDERLVCKIDEILYVDKDKYVYKKFDNIPILKNKITDIDINWNNIYYKALSLLIKSL